MRAWLICFLGILLCGCAGSSWPGHGDDRNAGDYPVIEQRWNAASKKRLGSAHDEAEIRRVLREAHPEMSLTELRWLSPTEAVAYTESGKNGPPGWLGYASYFCVFQKKDGKWQFIVDYLWMVS